MIQEETRRRELAIANFCRSWLYFNNFITDKENDNIHKKILKYRDKYNIIISNKQLHSVDIYYDDNVKEDE